MKMKRIISALLTVLMLMSSFAMMVGAEGEGTEPPVDRPTEYTYNTDNITSLLAPNPDFESLEIGVANTDRYLYQRAKYLAPDGETLLEVETPEDKLKLMDYRYGNDQYGLYIDAYSGEVAVKCWKTGEILFTNPYNIGDSKATISTRDTVREELLSQLIVNFTNLENSSTVTYLSYIEAVERSQITVKNIKGGLRVEYAIGREATKTLVPRQISKATMEKKILSVFQEKLPEWNKPNTEDEALYKKFTAFWELKDPNGSYVSQTEKDQMYKDFPYTKGSNDKDPSDDKPMYVILGDVKVSQIAWLEQQIKLYCPDYSFTDLDADHAEVGYEAKAEVYPLFKMALEYTLDDTGLVVRLPANGIRFDETRYQLNYIEVLPYMGAGSDPHQGYTFFPDGSGTLFDFQTIESLSGEQEVSGKMYGQDYAYHELSLLHKYTEEIRYPVFGIVEHDLNTNLDRGFVAIVEEGDSLMELTSYHAGGSSEYHTIRMQVDPRPSDSYNLQDAISVGNNATVTVVSSRKYTGSYTVRYIMLNDESKAEALGDDYYECNYVGMAKAYRDFLEKNGVLTRLTSKDVEKDIPLYIETFGAIWSTKKILSIPIDVTVPLTSFADVATMYDELSGVGIKNINFVLTGYTKGGLESEAVPYNLKWDSAVKDEMDFDELLQYSKDKDFGLFPDFDFVFSSVNTMFDGLSLNKHAVKTIDNRYTSKREYSATKHTYVSYFELALSPAYYSHFYEKFMPKYLKTTPTGISVSTLGSYLNSDFDEDEPFNRADSQEYTIQAFQFISEQMGDAEVMTSGGNAYSWKYVDHLKDVATDSSRYNLSSASVPFLGMVLHGYVEFAGTPINMEGNLNYAFLKSLESGAALNFILSYQNTATLKEMQTTSKYYSIRYDIWQKDLIEMYNELNALLKDVQTSTIDRHEFISTDVKDTDYVIRVPDSDELEADAMSSIQAAITEEQKVKEAQAKNMRDAVQKTIDTIKTLEQTLATATANLANADATLATKIAAVDELLTNPKADADAQKEALDSKWQAVLDSALLMQKEAYPAVNAYDNAVEALDYLENHVEGFDKGTVDNLKAIMSETAKIADVAEALRTQNAGFETKIAELKTRIEAKGYTVAAYNNASAAYTEGFFDKITHVNRAPQAESLQISSQYRVDDNSVVYQVYENGTAFLLNFNDYKVVVHFQGATYTINGYGYVVLSREA